MTDNRLSETCMLVNLSIRQWNAEREDKGAGEAVAAKYGNDVRMGKYRKFLVDPTALKPVTKIAGEARTRHYALSLPWSDTGDRIISAEGFDTYRKEMTGFKRRFEQAAYEFAEEYPNLVYNARRDLNGLFRANDYPEPGAILGRFGLKTKFRAVDNAEDFRVNIGEGEARVIRQQIEQEVTSQIGVAMEDVARRIRTVVSHMAESLKAYDDSGNKVANPFRDSLVGNVRTLADMLPALNLTNDYRIDEVTRAIQSNLCKFDADSLRGSSIVRDETANKASEILRKMERMGL